MFLILHKNRSTEFRHELTFQLGGEARLTKAILVIFRGVQFEDLQLLEGSFSQRCLVVDIIFVSILLLLTDVEMRKVRPVSFPHRSHRFYAVVCLLSQLVHRCRLSRQGIWIWGSDSRDWIWFLHSSRWVMLMKLMCMISFTTCALLFRSIF